MVAFGVPLDAVETSNGDLEGSVKDEDARREHRELQRLTHERIAHTNRVGSLLVMHNLRPGIAAVFDRGHIDDRPIRASRLRRLHNKPDI